MAKKSSQRVMDTRKRNCDRVSFVVPKDAKYLIRARAMREGISSAEMIRRAILARCGLGNWPKMDEWPPEPGIESYNAMVHCSDRESAAKALEELQTDEYMNANITTGQVDDSFVIYMPKESMKDEYIKALLDLLDAVEDVASPSAPPAQITISKKSLSVVQRLLANIETPVEDDEIGDEKK